MSQSGGDLPEFQVIGRFPAAACLSLSKRLDSTKKYGIKEGDYKRAPDAFRKRKKSYRPGQRRRFQPTRNKVRQKLYVMKKSRKPLQRKSNRHVG